MSGTLSFIMTSSIWVCRNKKCYHLNKLHHIYICTCFMENIFSLLKLKCFSLWIALWHIYNELLLTFIYYFLMHKDTVVLYIPWVRCNRPNSTRLVTRCLIVGAGVNKQASKRGRIAQRWNPVNNTTHFIAIQKTSTVTEAMHVSLLQTE
jgi:hypothetical protein